MELSIEKIKLIIDEGYDLLCIKEDGKKEWYSITEWEPNNKENNVGFHLLTGKHITDFFIRNESQNEKVFMVRLIEYLDKEEFLTIKYSTNNSWILYARK